MSTNTFARDTEHAIDPLFVERWSPRSYTGEAIPDNVLFGVLEAARWAPSGSNAQPWRFLYSRKNSPSWATYVGFLKPGNQRWAVQASALILVLSQRSKVKDGVVVPAPSHSFDAGAAWQNLALQAHQWGWATRAMGGFEKEQARHLLGVPEDYDLEAVIALGKPAARSNLPADLIEKEIPTPRLPLGQIAFEGIFPR